MSSTSITFTCESHTHTFGYYHINFILISIWFVAIIILSSGLVMSNTATSLLDHIAHMAVTRMLFSVIVKKTCGNIDFAFLARLYGNRVQQHHNFDQQLTVPRNICQSHVLRSFRSAIGRLYVVTNWLNVFIPYHFYFINLFDLCVHCYIQKFILIGKTSAVDGIHRNGYTQERLFKLMKTLSISMAFRFLECLPITSWMCMAQVYVLKRSLCL